MTITQGLLKRTSEGYYKPSLLFRLQNTYDHIVDFLRESEAKLSYTNRLDGEVLNQGSGLIFRDKIGNHFIFWVDENAYVE